MGIVAVLPLRGLANLDQLKTNALLPLEHEFVVLLVSVEGGRRQLVTPEGHMVQLECVPGVSSVLVENSVLVVAGLSEGPDVLFVKLMIDEGHVRVRGVSEHGLTLLIVEVEKRIVIIDGNDGRVSDDIFFLGHVGLHSLEGVILVESVSGSVIVVGGVLIDVGVPTVELIVDEGVRNSAVNN